MKKQDFRTPEKIAVVLPPDCKGTLDELCQFYGDGTKPATKDYVVSGLIKDAAEDREFKEWRKKNADSVTEISSVKVDLKKAVNA